MHIFIAVNIIWLLFAVLEVYFPNIALIFSSVEQVMEEVTLLLLSRLFWNVFVFFVVADVC